MRIPSGVTDQYIYFVAVDSTDLKTRETGLSTWTVYRSRNGGAAAAFTTPTINETDSTNMPGVYELLLDEDMSIDAGDDSQEMVFHITHAGMAPVTRTIELYRHKITAGETLTASSGVLPTVGAVTGAVGSVTGAVGSVTGAVASVTGNVGGNVTGSVGSVASGGITAASLAADCITAAKVAADVTTEIQSGLATAANLATVAGYLDTEIAAILADTNELQADWADGGRLDLILDARASQASVDTVDDLLDTEVAAIKTVVDAILVDTAEIGAAGAGLTALGITASGTLSGTHSSTTADLGTNAPANDISGQTLFFPGHDLARVVDSYNTGTGVATFSPSVAVTLANADAWILYPTPPASAGSPPAVTLTNAGIDALFTRALTESYAADGAAPTVAQALLLIQQILTELSISSTTGTVKKLDGTTTAATLTYNDATTPTSVTRSG